MSSVFHRLFGLGRLPAAAREQILTEGVLVEQEGLRGSITLRNFRGPGRYHGFKRSWFIGALVLTHAHCLAFRFSKPIIGVPWNHPRIRDISVSLIDNDVVCLQYEAADFDDNTSGSVEIRFVTPRASTFVRRFKEKAGG